MSLRLDPQNDPSINDKRKIVKGFYTDTKNTLRMIVTKSSVNGIIQDDTNTHYTKIKNFNIKKVHYYMIKNFLLSNKKQQYHIVSYNCATFAIAALKAAGMHVHFKKYFWNIGVPYILYPFLPLTVLAALSSYSLCRGYTPAGIAHDISKGIV
ncbi:MAG: hypothetical protein IJ333_02085 [Clostridia bacterium]|nr:hypothetical protein [Clostridia bacterium]